MIQGSGIRTPKPWPYLETLIKFLCSSHSSWTILTVLIITTPSPVTERLLCKRHCARQYISSLPFNPHKKSFKISIIFQLYRRGNYVWWVMWFLYVDNYLSFMIFQNNIYRGQIDKGIRRIGEYGYMHTNTLYSLI